MGLKIANQTMPTPNSIKMYNLVTMVRVSSTDTIMVRLDVIYVSR